MFGWWAEGGNASSFVWITVGAEKLSFHWFDQPRLAKNLSMGQQLTMLFSHRSFLVKSVKIDQRGEFARSAGNRGVTWVITQRDLSLWATRLLLNKSDKVKQTWLQVFWFCWTNAKTHAKQKLWNSLTKKEIIIDQHPLVGLYLVIWVHCHFVKFLSLKSYESFIHWIKAAKK